MRLKKILLFLILALQATPVFAQSHVEFEVQHSSLTAGLAAWNDVNIRNYFAATKNDQVLLETDMKSHFSQTAFLLNANLTHVYQPLWYQDFSLTWASNDQVAATKIAFTEIHRKFLEDQSLVGGLGLGYSEAASPYHDQYVLGELAYYTSGIFSFQAGLRLNQSHPGSVTTFRYFGILNFYQTNQFEGFLKLESGREGYTVISSNSFKNEFASTSETVQLHYWLNRIYGVGSNVEFYQSSFYERTSVALSFLMRY